MSDLFKFILGFIAFIAILVIYTFVMAYVVPIIIGGAIIVAALYVIKCWVRN